jgi:HprK-related kinase A
MRLIADADVAELRALLQSTGLHLDLGAATLAVRSSSDDLARQILAVYGAFPLEAAGSFADIHIDVDPVGGWRRFTHRQVVLRCDGEQHFYPFPADTALPLMEWGTNWLIGQRLHNLLLFHAGCLERDGLGLLLPATPGSGKSTLTAALAHRSWRLLSDEFGVCDPSTGELRAMLKPIALKNTSIDVIRAFAPQARLGPAFPNTRKGTVVHVAADADAVRRRHAPATPALVILPKWMAGAGTRLQAVGEDELFKALAFNSFNYEILGATGFSAVMDIVKRCRGLRLEYENLDDAVARLDALWPDLVAQHRTGRGTQPPAVVGA